MPGSGAAADEPVAASYVGGGSAGCACTDDMVGCLLSVQFVDSVVSICVCAQK